MFKSDLELSCFPFLGLKVVLTELRGRGHLEHFDRWRTGQSGYIWNVCCYNLPLETLMRTGKQQKKHLCCSRQYGKRHAVSKNNLFNFDQIWEGKSHCMLNNTSWNLKSGYWSWWLSWSHISSSGDRGRALAPFWATVDNYCQRKYLIKCKA